MKSEIMINSTKARIIIIAILIPVIVALLLEFNLIWEVETDNDWIGFYASYVGSIIGVYGVFEVMRIDQRKREKERKDVLFLNNLPIYRKIASSINVERLYELKKKLTEIRSDENWNMVDSSTKRKLKQIESNLYYSDEHHGLFYTVREFISNNLFDELKEPLNSPVNEFNESFEYDGVHDEVLDAMTGIVINNSDFEIIYENNIELRVSKDKLLEKLENDAYTKGYEKNIDVIYTKLSNIKGSREWSDYISKRAATFKQITDLRNYINSRIDNLLNY